MAFAHEPLYDRDADLVMEYRQGDGEAFNQLMRLHLPWVYGLCRRISGNEAEDLCQEIFLKVYQNLHSLKNPRAFSAWLRKLTWHHCRRRNMQVRHHEPIDENGALSNLSEYQSEGAELGWAFDQLPLGQRQVITLSFIYGFTEREISTILHIPAGTVKSRLHKARKRLQTLLAQKEGDIGVDISDRIIKEIEDRIQEFNDRIIIPVQANPEIADSEVQRWQRLRQGDAEHNAALYGIELAESGPRMTREKWMCGTLSRQGITRAVMGIPDYAKQWEYRDICRRLLVSPFTLLKWERQGMPVIRYYPWKWFDINLIKKWLAENAVDMPREVEERDVDDFMYYVLKEVEAGRASAEDALEILRSN